MIDRMRAALAKAEAIGKPLTEYRLHPDDYEALRKQCEPLLRYPANSASDSFSGLRIVIDRDAPRLPRLKTPNDGTKRGDTACRGDSA